MKEIILQNHFSSYYFGAISWTPSFLKTSWITQVAISMFYFGLSAANIYHFLFCFISFPFPACSHIT
jgi:hypothetical protein